MDTKKLSFLEIQEQQAALKSNSDLQNLATALMHVKDRQQELAELEANILDLAYRIEKGYKVPVEEVVRLYEMAQGRSNKRF